MPPRRYSAVDSRCGSERSASTVSLKGDGGAKSVPPTLRDQPPTVFEIFERTDR